MKEDTKYLCVIMCGGVLKYVSKLWTHFLTFFNNFVVFYSICVFSSEMISLVNEHDF